MHSGTRKERFEKEQFHCSKGEDLILEDNLVPFFPEDLTLARAV